MSDNPGTIVEASGEAATAQPPGRHSTVAFPYVALDEASNVASTIYNTHGTSCDDAQLAAGLNTTVTSSKFRSLVSAAKTFGLIDRRSKTVSLTELGSAVVDPTKRDEALVEAFLAVPLYRKLYDKFAGTLLPQDAGLEAEIQALGVTPKSVARARQTLQRSAYVAGFFHAGRNRLVRPATPHDTEPPPVSDPEQEAATATDASETQSAIPVGPSDPLLVGLWSKLPATGSFSKEEQEQWLELAKLALAMVYGSMPNGVSTHDSDDGPF